MAAPRRIGEKFAIEIEGDTWRIEVPEREPEQKTTWMKSSRVSTFQSEVEAHA